MYTWSKIFIYFCFSARDQYKEIMRMSMHMLMRPNLYIYLDAPVDHVSYIGKFIKNESTTNLFKKSNLSYHILLKVTISFSFIQIWQVIKNIQNRGNEWDKNSPVWTNKRYLSDIYNELKRNFLKEQQWVQWYYYFSWL